MDLPVVDHTRVEFGASRTVCDCKTCLDKCRFIPGYLIPADLDRLRPAGADLLAWAREHLRASPGAIALRLHGDGRREVVRIPTLVPAHRDDLSCHWLAGGRCTVHAVAPFGCSFFDCSQPRALADRLSTRGLTAIGSEDGPAAIYRRVWDVLWSEGLRAPGPELKLAALAAHQEGRG